MGNTETGTVTPDTRHLAPDTSVEIFRVPRISLLARPQFVEPPHLAVQWKGEASDGEKLAEYAGRLCYMSQHNPFHCTARCGGSTNCGRASREMRGTLKISTLVSGARCLVSGVTVPVSVFPMRRCAPRHEVDWRCRPGWPPRPPRP